MTQKKPVYTLTGTVSGDSTYVVRKADIELLHYCRDGEYAYVLSPRQLGKSSLMVRTATEIEKDGFQSVIIDLSELGITVTQQQWYLGILSKLDEGLKLKTSYIKWWDKNAHISETQRLVRFFQEVVLQEVGKKIVVFIDEVDTTLRLKFTDDFFIAIRAMYNARAITPAFKRVSFVLIGTASPTDFIKDPKRTPFNIGHKIELSDFSLDEAFSLTKDLDKSPSQAKQILQWIFEWTSGHPYLTQNISYLLSQKRGKIGRDDVATAVQEKFLGHGEQLDDHLKHIRTMLFERTKDARGVIGLYQQILKGEQIQDNEQSVIASNLKLSGIVRVRNEYLKVSNKIYESVFDTKWVEKYFPQSRNPIPVVISLASYLVILIATVLFLSQRLSSPVGLPSFLSNILTSATFPLVVAIWLLIAIANKSSRDSFMFRLSNLLTKPIIFERDISNSIEFYPRALLEAFSAAVREALYLPLRSLIDIFRRSISSQFNLLHNPYKPLRTLGYSFFIILFVLFVFSDATTVISTLEIMGVISYQVPPLFQRFEITVLMGSLLSVVVGALILSEAQSEVSLYSDWDERRGTPKYLARFSAVLLIVSGILVVVGLAIQRLQATQVITTNTEIDYFINLTFLLLVPLNNVLATALIFTEAMKGLFLITIGIQWGLVGILYITNYLFTTLGYILPVVTDYIYRLTYLVASIFSYILITPIDLFVGSFTNIFKSEKY